MLSTVQTTVIAGDAPGGEIDVDTASVADVSPGGSNTALTGS